MRKANIKGALVGVEAVTPEGLKSVFKEFNLSGEGLVKQLQTFRAHGLHMLGSFIFGLPSDKPDTFKATADLASRAGLAFAQFVMLTPFPGTVDFLRWEKEQEKAPVYVEGIPVTRFWLIPAAIRPKMFMPHPLMSSQEISNRTQGVWDRFYSFSSIWKRSEMRADSALPGCLCLSLQALPQDVRRHRHQHRQRAPQESKFRRALAFPVHAQVLHLETNAGACHAGLGKRCRPALRRPE